VTVMASIESVTLDVADLTAANRFYTGAFGLGTQVRLRASEAPTTGFRGFTLSLTVSQPATVNGLIGAALDAGATSLKPAAKSFGATAASYEPRTGLSGRSRRRRRRTPARPPGRSTRSCSCWEPRTWPRASGSTLTAAWPWRRALAASTSSSPLRRVPSSWALYGRRAAAKDAGVSPEGTGSHRLMVGSDAGPFTDPDGFAWEEAAPL
jgi:hypothetical protein